MMCEADQENTTGCSWSPLHSGLIVDRSTEIICWQSCFLLPNGGGFLNYICQQLRSDVSTLSALKGNGRTLFLHIELEKLTERAGGRQRQRMLFRTYYSSLVQTCLECSFTQRALSL